MLIRNLLQSTHLLSTNLFKIKIILSTLTFFSLISITPSPNKIYTEQSPHDIIAFDNYIFIDNKNIHHLKNNEFNLKNHTPHKSILIKSSIINLKQILTIITTLKSKQYFGKNIVIKIVDTKAFYTSHKKLFDLKVNQKIKQTYKALFIQNTIDPFNHNDNTYFCVIDLQFNTSNNIIIDLFKNYRPNSDLLFIAETFFPFKIVYNISYLVKTDFIINVIKLSLKKDIKSMSRFVALLRCISNLHGHSFGYYYYVPFMRGVHIRYVDLVPFIGMNVVSEIVNFIGVEGGFEKMMKFDVRIVGWILFIRYPWVLILGVKFFGLEWPGLLMFVSVVNPLSGFFMSFIVYCLSLLRLGKMFIKYMNK